jgi:hypothetical protein
MHFCKAYATRNSCPKHALEDHSSELASNSAKRVRLSPCIDPDNEFEDSTGHFKSPANVSNAPELEMPQASPLLSLSVSLGVEEEPLQLLEITSCMLL